MADRLQGKTTRKFDGYIYPPNIQVRLATHEVNYQRTSCRYLGFVPIRHEMTNGYQPNLWTFKYIFFAGDKQDRRTVDYANFEEVIKTFMPKQKPMYLYSGFSENLAFNDLDPMSASDKAAFLSRLNTNLSEKTQIPYVDIWDAAVAGSDKFLGRHWLTNISVDGFQGIVLTFADARARNYEKSIVGKWLNLSQAVVYSPYDDAVFNANGQGNMATIDGTRPDNREFQEDWRGSEQIDTTGVHKWTCWDMLLYLWSEQASVNRNSLVQFIAKPTTDSPAWKMWKTYGGYRTPEIDISGLSIAEALDAIIRASGEFSWTLEPPANNESSRWEMRPFHLCRYTTYSYSGSQTDLDRAMPSRSLTLPDRDSTLAGAVMVNDLRADMQSTQRLGHLVYRGAKIIVETTFSTDGDDDYSCADKNATTGSGTATLEWTGDTSAFQTAYAGATGSKQKKLNAAMAADDVAYRVCALKRTVQYKFAPTDGSWIPARRELMPYRLPQPSGSANDPVEANEQPDIIVWIRKPNASEWILATSKQGAELVGSWTIDPKTGGIRFANALVDVATWTAWDVKITAAIELDERLMVEIGRSDFFGKSAVMDNLKHRFGVRWNALMVDDTTIANGIIVNDRQKLYDEAMARFAEFDRERCSAVFNIPWPERYISVGDWIGELRSGQTNSQNPNPHSRTTEMAVVGVVIDYQGLSTEIKTENWKQ